MKTPQELDGVELRECVAREVFGYEACRSGLQAKSDPIPRGWQNKDGQLHGLPAYESDIAVAFTVADKTIDSMSETAVFELSVIVPGSGDANQWTANFSSLFGTACFAGAGDTAPLAICRAALEAVRAMRA